jgi:type IX secretion system PorP/SprF family membrane protein
MPVYSQYVLNEFLINPSIAGIDGMTTVNLTGRKQWLGFSNTPETYSASVSTRILKSPLTIRDGKIKKGSEGRVGLGGALISDRNGAINRTSIQITYAYHIFIRNSQLSFGLSGVATQFRIDEKLAELKNPNGDPLTGILGKSAYMPDANAGICLSTMKTRLGFSISQIFQSPIKFGEVYINPKELKHIRQYTLYGFYINNLKDKPDWQIEPSLLIRGNENLQFSADISGRLIYMREYWTGLSIRTSGELILMLGLKMNRFFFGYSFDYGFNEMSRLSYGSHEVVIALKLGDSTRRYRWIERY